MERSEGSGKVAFYEGNHARRRKTRYIIEYCSPVALYVGRRVVRRCNGAEGPVEEGDLRG